MTHVYVVVRHRPSSIDPKQNVSYPVQAYKTFEAAEECAETMDAQWSKKQEKPYHTVVITKYSDV